MVKARVKPEGSGGVRVGGGRMRHLEPLVRDGKRERERESDLE